MKLLLKILGVLLLIVILLAVGTGIAFHEKEPAGKNPSEADNLARAMMAAVDKPAWDSTRWVQWTFRSGNTYVWDKERHYVLVSKNNQEVRFNAHTMSGNVSISGQAAEGKKIPKLIQKAWSAFCNDSFWLNPVVKAFDDGTKRTMVTLKDGREGIKVTFGSGGVTPGDSYVWILGADNLPVAWKMWVSIIPVGGIETTWDKWSTLPTGARIATHHSAFGRNVEMISNLNAGLTYTDLGYETDPFAGM